jgi:hypothetical protein
VPTVRCRVKLECEPNVTVDWSGNIEFDVDCHICSRRNRCVRIAAGYPVWPGSAWCQPGSRGGGDHAFPIRVIRWRPSREAGELELDLQYEFEPFTDCVDGARGEAFGPHPWIRVHFTVGCPSCHYPNLGGIQNNTGRPFAVQCDNCNAPLYRKVTPPTFSVIDPGPELRDETRGMSWRRRPR